MVSVSFNIETDASRRVRAAAITVGLAGICRCRGPRKDESRSRIGSRARITLRRADASSEQASEVEVRHGVPGGSAAAGVDAKTEAPGAYAQPIVDAAAARVCRAVAEVGERLDGPLRLCQPHLDAPL